MTRCVASWAEISLCHKLTVKSADIAKTLRFITPTIITNLGGFDESEIAVFSGGFAGMPRGKSEWSGATCAKCLSGNFQNRAGNVATAVPNIEVINHQNALL